MKRFNPLALLCATTALTSATIFSPAWAQGKTNSQAPSLEEQVVAQESAPADIPPSPVIDTPTAGRPPTQPTPTTPITVRQILDPRVIFAADSFFAFDRSDLRLDNVRTPKKIVTEEERKSVDTARRKLDALAERLKRIDIQSVGIYGHTDSDGPDIYNQKLSQRRAESIRQYLISRGVPAEKIRSYGEGEVKPIADNATREGRAKNRRVEIEINGAMAK